MSAYLQAYTTALKNTPFKKAYIDAFAGSGYRVDSTSKAQDRAQLLFPDLAEDEPQELLEGSARLALQTIPPFDECIFIE